MYIFSFCLFICFYSCLCNLTGGKKMISRQSKVRYCFNWQKKNNWGTHHHHGIRLIHPSSAPAGSGMAGPCPTPWGHRALLQGQLRRVAFHHSSLMQKVVQQNCLCHVLPCLILPCNILCAPVAGSALWNIFGGSSLCTLESI